MANAVPSIDGVTERKLTALILAEAARLKRQAEEEGVRAYLNPKVRYRPNARFLQATVRGVAQANRVAEMSDMWRLRNEEISREHSEEPPGGEPTTSSTHDVDRAFQRAKVWDRVQSHSRDSTRGRHADRQGDDGTYQEGADPMNLNPSFRRKHSTGAFPHGGYVAGRSSTGLEERTRASQGRDSCHLIGRDKDEAPGGPMGKMQKRRREEDGSDGPIDRGGPCGSKGEEQEQAEGGVDDVDMEQFLQSRRKRGRGAVGARMDTAGPYEVEALLVERVREQWEKQQAPAGHSGRRCLGPTVQGKVAPGEGGERWQRGMLVEEAGADMGEAYLSGTRKVENEERAGKCGREGKDERREELREKERRREGRKGQEEPSEEEGPKEKRKRKDEGEKEREREKKERLKKKKHLRQRSKKEKKHRRRSASFEDPYEDEDGERRRKERKRRKRRRREEGSESKDEMDHSSDSSCEKMKARERKTCPAAQED